MSVSVDVSILGIRNNIPLFSKWIGAKSTKDSIEDIITEFDVFELNEYPLYLVSQDDLVKFIREMKSNFIAEKEKLAYIEEIIGFNDKDNINWFLWVE